MPLDPDRVQAVFGAAIECDPAGDRAAVLDRECSTDAELRRRVEALLRAHDEPDSLLDRPIVGPDAEAIGLGRTEAGSVVGAPAGGDPTIGLRAEVNLTVAVAVPSEMGFRVAPAVPGYEIMGELGRGGMGVVYKAREIRLNRACALKMILGGAHAGPEASARFLAEAQAIARLQHPHIVQIHHIGEAEGLPFFELEYVDGGGLDKALDGTPWAARRAAGLVELLAGAVAEAHRQGIVHRDLKPGNVLLTADGTPKVTDFGLAKSLDTDSGLTATDSIMGSPGYMAPEQAAGQTKLIGPPADVYALGATLYELLTGRPPFRGATILETLEHVKSVDPVTPSRLVPGLPRDVETIALKCLQKEPGRRYDSAASLAEDLRRFLGGEPIVARPVPFWERGWRWCRRHPAPAALIAAIVLVAALGLAGILWQWEEAVKARDLASRRAVAEAKARRETETILVDMYTTSGIAAGDQGEHARAALWFANAARRAEADPDRRLANAVRALTWGRRAFTPLRAVVAEGSWPGGLVFHPGGRHLITRNLVGGKGWDADQALWDLDADRPLPFPGGPAAVSASAWSPDGRSLAAGGPEGGVVVAPFPGGGEPTPIPFPGRIRLLTYSADGRYLAIAGGNSARVWDVLSGAFATRELVHPADVTTMAFHPEGRSLATGCGDGQARLFAVPGDVGSPLWPPVPHRQEGGSPWFPSFCSPPVFVDGGRELILYSGKGVLAWRVCETGAEVRTLDLAGLPRGIAATVPSPDGRYLAVFGVMMRSVQLVDVATGRPVGPALAHENTVYGAAFSPDGRKLATGSTDNTVRLWSVPEGEPLARPLDLHRPVHFVAFAPDGRSLATQDGDLVRIRALPEAGLPTAPMPLDGKSSFAALSPDGALAIPTGVSFAGERALRSTRASRVADGRPAGPPLRPGGLIVDAAFSPDGRSVATLSTRDDPSAEGGEMQVWDWASGSRRWRAALPSDPRSLAYRPDGRRLAVLCGGGELLVFDPDDGRESLRWRAHDAEPAHHWVNNGDLAFTPDGRGLLTWGMGNDVRAWDAEKGGLRYPPLRHRDKCHDVRFSPDGRLMALASYDGSVRVRDLATGAVVAELPAHPDIVYSAAFSPDGHQIVTACRDRTVRVWDWRAGRLACPPFEHAKEVLAATFTPDGRWVLSASVDGTARAWDRRTGKPVTPPLTIVGEPLSLAITPDGKHAIVGGGQTALAVLDLGVLDPTDVDPDALCLRAELLAGQRLHEGGGTVNLSADEWLDRWRAFRRRSPSAVTEPHVDPRDSWSDEARGPDASAKSRDGATPDDIAARFDLADASLGAGRIDEAASTGRELVPLLRRAVGQSPDDPSLRHRFALALVMADDRDGYRFACDATLKHFGRSEDPLIGEVARACLVGPGAVPDPAVPRRMAEAALSREPKLPWWHYVLGLADYRDGRYAAAVEHLGDSLKLGGWAAAPLNEPVLAMAHHRLGHDGEARRWLLKAHGHRAGSPLGIGPGVGLGSSVAWWDRLEFQLLLREADALILDAGFPADPFAP